MWQDSSFFLWVICCFLRSHATDSIEMCANSNGITIPFVHQKLPLGKKKNPRAVSLTQSMLFHQLVFLVRSSDGGALRVQPAVIVDCVTRIVGHHQLTSWLFTYLFDPTPCQIFFTEILRIVMISEFAFFTSNKCGLHYDQSVAAATLSWIVKKWRWLSLANEWRQHRSPSLPPLYLRWMLDRFFLFSIQKRGGEDNPIKTNE